MTQPESDEDIYICCRVRNTPFKALVLPGSRVGVCEICEDEVWIGPAQPHAARRQCLECTPAEVMLDIGMKEDDREVIAATMGLTDDEITAAVKAMSKDLADGKRGGLKLDYGGTP